MPSIMNAIKVTPTPTKKELYRGAAVPLNENFVSPHQMLLSTMR